MPPVSRAMLELVVARINAATNMPLSPYSKENKPCAGNYHIDNSDNRHSLRRMSLTQGCTGSEAVLACGMTTKKDLYTHMHTFLSGITLGKELTNLGHPQ